MDYNYDEALYNSHA